MTSSSIYGWVCVRCNYGVCNIFLKKKAKRIRAALPDGTTTPSWVNRTTSCGNNRYACSLVCTARSWNQQCLMNALNSRHEDSSIRGVQWTPNCNEHERNFTGHQASSVNSNNAKSTSGILRVRRVQWTKKRNEHELNSTGLGDSTPVDNDAKDAG